VANGAPCTSSLEELSAGTASYWGQVANEVLTPHVKVSRELPADTRKLGHGVPASHGK
jgi:hypothetical protein